MNNFDVKKRKVLSFQDFGKVADKAETAKHIEKGEHEIVKNSMYGEKKGDKGVATLDESEVKMSDDLDGVKIQKIAFKEFKTLVSKKEGIVLLGTGGNVDEWINGVTKDLVDEKIATGTVKDLWSEIYVMTTSGGRTDTALVFNEAGKFDMGKMAMWRLKFGNCSWISDYLDNYSKQHVQESVEGVNESTEYRAQLGKLKDHIDAMAKFAMKKNNIGFQRGWSVLNDIEISVGKVSVKVHFNADSYERLLAFIKEETKEDLELDK